MTVESPTSKWKTEEELIAAAFYALNNDAQLRAEAQTAAFITVPKSDNPSLTITLREVAMQAAAIALLIHEGPPDD